MVSCSSFLHIVLFEPEIPHNTGTLIRLSTCLNIHLHLIEPLGFVWSDRHLKRSMMDYVEGASLSRHASWDHFLQGYPSNRKCVVDVKGTIPFHQHSYHEGDCLIFGKESTGLPLSLIESADKSLRIPMMPNCRSLNLAISVALVISRAGIDVGLFDCEEMGQF